ncbi:MAG: hypothetical protein RMM28_03090 [Thermoleophilia bacterium]|nr:hypothetical protein [Thermoleophilia bacterium]
MLRRQALATYEQSAAAEVVDALARMRPRVDPRARATRERIEREHASSTATVVAALDDLARAEREADTLVYELYRIPARMRRMVDAQYA